MTRRSPIRVWVFPGLALLALLLLLPVQTAVAATKAYTMPRVYVAATIQPDGSLQVVEERTFQYTGSFSWVEQTVQVADLRDIAVAEVKSGGNLSYQADNSGRPGTFSTRQESGKTVIRWNFNAQDEQRVFQLAYRVPDAVRLYTDTAEVYWQFVGDQWKVPSGQVRARLLLPAGATAGAVGAWGHGPLNGVVTVQSDSEVRWEVTNLAPGAKLEGRVTFPLSLVPGGGRKMGQPGLSAILAEEQAAANRANQARQAPQGAPVPQNQTWPQSQSSPVYPARRVPEPSPYPGWLEPLLLGLLLPPGFWLLARAYRRHCTDPASQYSELPCVEPPADYPPAVLGVLLHGKKVGGQELVATLLDLSWRGHLTLEPTGSRLDEDLAIRWRDGEDGPRSGDQLAAHERLLTDFLFGEVGGGQNSVLLSEVKDYARTYPTGREVVRFLESWREAVQRAAEPYGFWDEESRDWTGAGVTLGVLVLVGAVVAYTAFRFTVLGLLLGLLAVGLVIAGASAGRRTQFGADERARWEAFGRYLEAFTPVADATVADLGVWGQYLAYGTALGVAQQFSQQLKLARPEADSDPFVDADTWLFHLNTFCGYMDHPVTRPPTSDSNDSGGGFFSSGDGSGGGFSDFGGGGDSGGGGGSDGGGGGDSG